MANKTNYWHIHVWDVPLGWIRVSTWLRLQSARKYSDVGVLRCMVPLAARRPV